MGAVNGQNVKADTKSNNSEPTPVTEGNLEENAGSTGDTVQAEAETADVDEDSDDAIWTMKTMKMIQKLNQLCQMANLLTPRGRY